MGYVYLYYGTGGGKTTNALGLALRSIGHRNKVVLIQFMKWWKDIGEYKIRERLRPYYEIYQFGRPGWLKFDENNQEIQVGGMRFSVRKSKDEDKEEAKKALTFAKQIMLEKKPQLLILDEICLAAYMDLLSIREILEMLKKIPRETNIVMTGRYVPKELIDRADFVNEIVHRKSPEKFVATKGIQY